MVMRQMRENTKWIMLITAAAFVGLMVFEWGMDFSGQSGAQLRGGEIGSIDGEPVTYEEYNRLYRQLYDQQQAAQGNQPLTPAQVRQIEDAAWEQAVSERLIERELARLDLQATDEEVRQAALNSPPPTFREAPIFQTEGRFDIQKYRQFLSSPTTDPQMLRDLEEYYRTVIPRNRLIQRVAAGVYVPDNELWRMYRDRNATATIRYVVLEPERLVPDAGVSVSDQEIRAYYEAHREDYRQPARAQVRYLTIDMRLTAEDTAASRQRAVEIKQELEEEGVDFASVARRESADPGSAQQGGDLGTFRRGQMVPAFEEAVWSAPIGQVTDPVATPFGFHLIQVQERTDSTASARHILVPVELSRDREDRLLARADSLEDLAETQSIDAAAERLGLEVRDAALQEGQPQLPGVGDASEGLRWAFNEAQPGDASPLFETETSYYLFELVSRRPERVLSLEEATPAVRLQVRRQKKLERARQIGRDMVDRLRQGGDLVMLAGEHNLEVREAGPFSRVDFVPGIGRTNAAIGAAFGLSEGQWSPPIEANQRLYIMQLTDRTEASREEWQQQLPQQRAQITGSLEQARVQQYLEELRQRADIVDRRQEAFSQPALGSRL